MERKTMSGEIAEGAGVPSAEAAEVAEVEVNETDAAASAEGVEDVTEGNGEGEVVPDADEDQTETDHTLKPAQQAAVNKRIAALTAKRKAAEQERDGLKAERDELKQRVERLGDETLMRVANTTGLLPELVEKGDAARIDQYEKASRSVEVFGEWLEDNTDVDAELTLNGQTYSRAQVREFKRQHQRRMQELADVPGLVNRVKRETADLIKLGLAAKKANWRPGQKAAGKPKLPVAPAPARTGLPSAGAKPRPAAGAVKKSERKIRNEDDLALAIENGEYD